MIKNYNNKIRFIVVSFIGITIFLAITRDNYLLAALEIITVILFVVLARTKEKFRIDERERVIREKASQTAYKVFAPTVGIGALLFLITSRIGPLYFINANFSYVETLGLIFAYLTLFLILIYSISYYVHNKKYEGRGDE